MRKIVFQSFEEARTIVNLLNLKNNKEWRIYCSSGKKPENKKKHHFLQISIIISGALIPIINSIPYLDIETRILSSILGGIIIIITGTIQLKKYQENWIQYRTTEEILKKEKFLYLNSAGEYSNLDDEEKHRLLVERTESVISNQNVNFFVTRNEKTNQKNF